MKKTFYYALTLLLTSASLPLEAVSNYDYELEHAYPQEQEAQAQKDKKKPDSPDSIYDHLLSRAYKDKKDSKSKKKKKKKNSLPDPKTGYDHMVYHPYQDTFQPQKKSLPFQKRVKQEEARREEISGTTESIASSMMGWGVGMTVAIMILSGVVRQSKNPDLATGSSSSSSS